MTFHLNKTMTLKNKKNEKTYIVTKFINFLQDNHDSKLPVGSEGLPTGQTVLQPDTFKLLSKLFFIKQVLPRDLNGYFIDILGQIF